MLHYGEKQDKIILLLLPNTDNLKQVEDYARGCTWQLIFACPCSSPIRGTTVTKIFCLNS